MTKEELTRLPVRIAIRREGKFVNAYLAESDSMENTTLLGSLAVGIAQRKDFYERWKILMADVMAFAVEDIYGQKPEMLMEPPPNKEQAGNA